MGKKKTRNIKRKKHDKIVNDYENQKQKHLEKLATKTLKQDEKLQRLKGKHINSSFLDKF